MDNRFKLATIKCMSSSNTEQLLSASKRISVHFWLMVHIKRE